MTQLKQPQWLLKARMYCINRKTILVMLVSTLFVASAARSEVMDEEINNLMNSVPPKQLDRERELERLDHVKAVMARLADISDSKARIAAPKNEKQSSAFVENFEQSVKAAMLSKGDTEQAASSAPVTKKVEKPTFTEDVELISLWGDQTDPTADIFINSRVTQVNKGSFIKGWEIKMISTSYMTLSKDRVTAKVYFANVASGE